MEFNIITDEEIAQDEHLSLFVLPELGIERSQTTT